MTPSELRVVGGAVTIAGSGLFALAWVTSMLLGDPRIEGVEVARWLAVPAHVLLLLGMVTIYLAQADRLGVAGLVAFLLSFCGFAVFIGYVVGGWTAAIPEPRLGPVAGLMWLGGLLLLALTTWRAGVLPAGAAALWVLGGLLYATGVPASATDAPRVTALIGAVLFSAGFSWAGIQVMATT